MTALSESFCLMSIHNVLSWPISTLLLFIRIGKPVLDTHHKSSSSCLVHLNQHSIPSPILEKIRGGLAREEEFLADQVCLSVQASQKKKGKYKKTPVLRSGLFHPNFLYSFFLDQQPMWLFILVVPSAYNH